MDADLDTLATALYVRTDDLLKAAPQQAPWRPKVGIAPKITDAELVTLAVMQALECARSREAVARSDLAGWAEYGSTAPATPGSSGGCGCTWCAPCTGYRSGSR